MKVFVWYFKYGTIISVAKNLKKARKDVLKRDLYDSVMTTNEPDEVHEASFSIYCSDC